jgi:hypothetical protein
VEEKDIGFLIRSNECRKKKSDSNRNFNPVSDEERKDYEDNYNRERRNSKSSESNKKESKSSVSSKNSSRYFNKI